jgi:hypothetical protein
MLVIFMPWRVMPDGRQQVKPQAPRRNHSKPQMRLAIVRAVGREKRLIKQRYRQPAPG